ncbi:unnamed protein product [Ceutorhynchus assimilis]|uniref:Uncharacterized protein n=1 Tax=Ceutorhynchus assimilis TaxID=467358 RepID=A0A9N9MFZ3_9CUCU|nr:unnamed protein product [Ceutorhynchus assimilis]
MEVRATKRNVKTRSRSSRSSSPNHTMINGRLMGEHACDNTLLHIPKPILVDNKGRTSKHKPTKKNPFIPEDFSSLEFSSESSCSDNLGSVSQLELFNGYSDCSDSPKSKIMPETAHLDQIFSLDSRTESGRCRFVKKCLSCGDLTSKAYWYSGEPNINKNVKLSHRDELNLKSEFPTQTSYINWIESCKNVVAQCSFELKLKKSLSDSDLMNELYNINNYKVKKSSSMITINRKSSYGLPELLKSAKSITDDDDTCIGRQRGTKISLEMVTSILEEELRFTEKEYKDWLRRRNWFELCDRPPRKLSYFEELNRKNSIKMPEKRVRSSCSIFMWTVGLAAGCVTILFLWFGIF